MKKKKDNIGEVVFAMFFLLVSLPFAYLFLIVKIAWMLAGSWYQEIYIPKETK